MVKQIISWVDRKGVEYQLSDAENFEVLLGTKGFYMPPFSFTEEEAPNQEGSTPRNVKVKARDIDLPLRIIAKDELDLEIKLRQLTRMFNPLKADGKIKVVGYGGSQRELNCRYTSGFEMEDLSDTRGQNWQKAIGVFRAFDPYWYDVATQVKTFTPGQPATFFPFFPLRLSSSSVLVDTTVDNEGDVETWPEWIITGPGENIVLRNLTTGELTYLETSIFAGESITINTKNKEKTITKNDGTNLYGTQTDESSLWALQDGQNSIRIEMSNATSDSSVQLTYRNRYWGP